MHLGVLVDRCVDPVKQPGAIEPIEMLVQIGVSARLCRSIGVHQTGSMIDVGISSES